MITYRLNGKVVGVDARNHHQQPQGVDVLHAPIRECAFDVDGFFADWAHERQLPELAGWEG